MKISGLYLLVVGLFLSSCSKPSNSTLPHSKILRINFSAEPTTLDPRKARNEIDLTTCRMLYEGLTRISKDGTAELALADQVEISEDRRRYIFHLKKAFWSNGDLVTSYDFAESWKSILNPLFPTDIAYKLYVIEHARQIKTGEQLLSSLGIETPDAQTLIVHLENPTPYFLELCSTSAFLPVPHLVAAINPNWSYEPKTFVGNGPFTLADWAHTSELKVVKNFSYWDANSVSLDGIEILMVPSDAEIQLFEENMLDWAGSPMSSLPIAAIPSLKKSNKLKVCPLSGTYFLRTNTCKTIHNKKNLLSSVDFRKALTYSIDRKAIILHILQGGQVAAHSLVPPEMGLFGDGYFSTTVDCNALVDEALNQLNLRRDTIEPIVISFISSDRNMSIAQAIHNQIERNLGIPFVLEAVEAKVFYEKIKQKEFQLAVASWFADFNDPINFLEVFKFKTGSTNNTDWESAAYMELLDKSAYAIDLEQRRQILRQAEEILMDQLPIIPIFHYAMNFLQKKRIVGVALSPIGQIDFRWTKIECEELPE